MGLPWEVPTTRSATSSALRKNSPACTVSMCPLADSLPAPFPERVSITLPAGMAMLAARTVACKLNTSKPRSRKRTGSSQTWMARPGPPMVCTSRVPGTALSSDSKLCATNAKSTAALLSGLHKVSASTGTSSMPLGLTIGGKVPRSRGNQSWLALSTSYKRTKASVRGTPTLNCTVSTATPGRDTA